jgi:hypothetical protein
MADRDPANDASPPSGPFYVTWGPTDGPILARDHPPTLGVVDAPDAVWSIGIAYPWGQVEHRRGPARTFRLTIGKVELEGRWICLRRQFIKLGDAAEEI